MRLISTLSFFNVPAVDNPSETALLVSVEAESLDADSVWVVVEVAQSRFATETVLTGQSLRRGTHALHIVDSTPVRLVCLPRDKKLLDWKREIWTFES